jgi:hypothetical protein
MSSSGTSISNKCTESRTGTGSGGGGGGGGSSSDGGARDIRMSQVNPSWAKLPLFDRTGWKRVRFGV